MLKQFSLLFVARVVLAVTGVAFWFLASKFYSVADIGRASALFSGSSLIQFFAYFFVIPVVRFLPCSKNPKKLIFSLYSSSCFVLFLGIILFVLWTKFFVKDFQDLNFLSYLVWGIASYLLFFNQYGEPFFVAEHDCKPVAISSVILNVLRLFLVPLFVVFGPIGLFSTVGVSASIAFFYLFAVYQKHSSGLAGEYRYDFSVIKEVFSYSAVNFLGALSVSIVGSLFPLLLITFFGAREAGLFYLPWMMFSVVSTCLFSSITVVLATASRHGSIKPFLKKGILVLGGLSILATLFFFFFGGFILGLFKEEFLQESFMILKVLFLSLLPNVVCIYISTILNFAKDLKNVLFVTIATIVFLIIFAIYFVPKYAGLGIALAWLFSNISTVIACLVVLSVRKAITTAINLQINTEVL